MSGPHDGLPAVFPWPFTSIVSSQSAREDRSWILFIWRTRLIQVAQKNWAVAHWESKKVATALAPIGLSCAGRLSVRLQWHSAVQLLCRVVIKDPTTTRRRCCYTTSWNIWHLLTHGCQYAGFLRHPMFLGLGWFPYQKRVPELCLASHLTCNRSFHICRIAAPDN